jgi:hypothetical protein
MLCKEDSSEQPNGFHVLLKHIFFYPFPLMPHSKTNIRPT